VDINASPRTIPTERRLRARQCAIISMNLGTFGSRVVSRTRSGSTSNAHCGARNDFFCPAWLINNGDPNTWLRKSWCMQGTIRSRQVSFSFQEIRFRCYRGLAPTWSMGNFSPKGQSAVHVLGPQDANQLRHRPPCGVFKHASSAEVEL
jgi:hypothetical protein